VPRLTARTTPSATSTWACGISVSAPTSQSFSTGSRRTGRRCGVLSRAI
ncbi:uncharacterized protein METZ01_LOCUS396598, partial [marine metagenome]